MTKVLAIILLFAFSVQCFQQGFIIVSYYTNKACYAAKCENKFRPELKCQGKCVMMQKVLAQKKQEQKQPELKLDNKVELFHGSSAYSGITVFDKKLKNRYPSLHPGETRDWSAHFFNPPGC